MAARITGIRGSPPADDSGLWVCPRCGTEAASWRGGAGHVGGDACDAALTERRLRAEGWVPAGKRREACEAMGAPVIFALGFVSDAQGLTRRVRVLAWTREPYAGLARFWGAKKSGRSAIRTAVAQGDAEAGAHLALLVIDGTTKFRVRPRNKLTTR